MDPITIMAAAGALGGVASGVIGQLLAQGKIAEAEAQLKSGLANIKDQQVGPSAMRDIQDDPATRDAQMRALQQISQVASQGGMTATDKAQLNDIEDQSNANEQGNRQAVLQSMMARGAGGSGMDLAAQLSNEQGSANQASRQGLNVASMAQQRALSAMSQMGALGGSVRGQDFNQASAKAQATDAINQFNSNQAMRAQESRTAQGNNIANVALGQAAQIANSGSTVGQGLTQAGGAIANYQGSLNRQAPPAAPMSFDNNGLGASGTPFAQNASLGAGTLSPQALQLATPAYAQATPLSSGQLRMNPDTEFELQKLRLNGGA